jgi:hypothetical protein
MQTSSHLGPSSASPKPARPIDPRQTLCAAIAERRIVAFIYKGRLRTAEPHILGADHQGEAILSAWQLSGGSGEAFRTYRLQAMSKVRLTGAQFAGPRPAYNPRHTIFAEIDCRL